MVFKCRSLFNEATYLAALSQLHSPFAILEANSKQLKTKIYEKNHLLLQITAVIGRYGPHLMIVMIFVTQNNLKRSRNFQLFPWILPFSVISFWIFVLTHLELTLYWNEIKMLPCKHL